jgi:hypothetical protein
MKFTVHYQGEPVLAHCKPVQPHDNHRAHWAENDMMPSLSAPAAITFSRINYVLKRYARERISLTANSFPQPSTIETGEIKGER